MEQALGKEAAREVWELGRAFAVLRAVLYTRALGLDVQVLACLLVQHLLTPLW